MNPYQALVSSYASLWREGRQIPMGNLAPTVAPRINPDAGTVLIFSPHPDDECIIGAIALRLLRESGCRVANVAVTQGTLPSRQQGRLEELKQACAYLHFDLIQTSSTGLSPITLKTRETDTCHWGEAVEVIAGILQREKPRVILFPHANDWNSAHIGVHHLLMDALKIQHSSFACHTVETEYWGQNMQPNLMVESSESDVADLVAGTSCHVVEVTRNPFHLLMPAWMQDNVRRGSELVGGQGQAAPDFGFATLYQVRRWAQGGVQEAWKGGKMLSKTDNPLSIFEPAS